MHANDVNVSAITNGIYIDNSMKDFFLIMFTKICILRNLDPFYIFYIFQYNRIFTSLYIFLHFLLLQKFSLLRRTVSRKS